MCDPRGPDGTPNQANTLRRTLDQCVLAPVGVVMTAVEDLPALIAEELPALITEGRRRVELQLANARVVGKFVVSKTERRVTDRIGTLLGNDRSEPPPPSRAPSTSDAAPTRSVPDAAAGAVVGGALADYDTLSASQVVRRLESLGPEELRAVQRYEASTRNRRTILNRAGQLLEARPPAPPAP